MTKLVGFLPVRAGSERVVNKNMRPFADFQGGLLELKLRQLAQVPELDRILVSSNDDASLEFAARFAREHDGRIIPLRRPDEYGRSSTSMGEFIRYIATLEDSGIIFWTHVTSPFVTSAIYREAIREYFAALASGHDSLVSVTRMQRFFWSEDGPVNYDHSCEKWPRSQDLKPLLEINHAIYMLPFDLMRKVGDRIGRSPLFFNINEHDAADIDWEDQFIFLEKVAKLKSCEGQSLL